MQPTQRLSNNLAGAFFIAVIFLVMTLLLDRIHPAAATGKLVTLFCALGLAALVGWTWCTVKAVSPKD
jgi:hypothetical protein